MKKFFLACCLLIGLLTSNAQQPYSVSTIPDSLLQDANAIKRLEEVELEIKSTTSAIRRYKYAYTILNENGDRHAQFVEWYKNKMVEVSDIEGSLYDASGKLIKKLKSKDIEDRSATDDGSLMDDSRVKLHNFYYKTYPYTVEYSASVKQNHSFFFPFWSAQNAEHLAVEKASFTVLCPSDYEIRYKANNYSSSPSLKTEKGQKVYNWVLTNKQAIKSEPFSSWRELATLVHIAPTAFEMEGYSGNMSSWKEFGKFLYELKKGRDVLPDPIRQKVQQLTTGIADDKQKVKLLYEYMQQNTRYISIQLGIGGWQPFEASSVAAKGYGDCKALSNYMYSLLKEANIKSHYAVIKAGSQENHIMEDFPSNQFNHVVLCVPLQRDTLWLECTSQTDPAGYMGDFTGNRKALIIDEQGGALVSTPRYTLNDNLQTRTITGKINETGNLQAQVSSAYRSIQQDNIQKMINSLSKDKIKEVLQKELELATYRIVDFSYLEKKSESPEIVELLAIDVSNYATITGKRIFITPNILNRSNIKLNTEKERMAPIHINYEYKDIDSVILDLPEGYEPESVPQPLNLKTKFGTFRTAVKLDKNKLTYTRTREQFAGRFPATDFKELAGFYEQIYKADRGKIVLVKKAE